MIASTSKNTRPASQIRFAGIVIMASLLISSPAFSQAAPQFTPGNLVVVVEGCGIYGGANTGACVSIPNGTGTGTGNSSAGGYGDNQAAPLTLFQYSPSGTTGATYVNSLVLPQNTFGANFPVSSEYGSSSEGSIQLSGSGQYLTVMGYGINAATFDAAPITYGAAPSLALAQSGSLTGQTYTPVARVVALIDANGTVNSSTGLFNIFNTNNPRSIFTANGTSAYVSGQGSGSDGTGGVFFVPLGDINNAPTPITGLDTSTNTASQDTREVQVRNSTLYVSVDSKAGTGAARSFVGTIGTPGTLPTTLAAAPTYLNGFGTSTSTTGKVTITTGPNSTGNAFNAGLQINISPSNFFFANASTLYVADTGNSKQTSATSTKGNGGLQKWINSSADGSGTWNLAYTLYNGLNLVLNTSGTGVAGLYGLTGAVSNGNVQLFATSATLSDLDTTYLYGITDNLSFTTASQATNETFAQLDKAPIDSNFKGVSFTPTVAAPTPLSLVLTRTLSRASGNITVQVTVANTSGTQAATVALTGVKIGGVAATPTPQTLGNIAGGASASATVTVPGAVGASGAASTISITGTYNGGTFGSTARVTLP